MMEQKREPIQKVIQVGRGAIGSILATYMLEALGEDNFAFVVDPVRKEKYEKNPLKINGKEKVFPLLSPQEQPAFGKADLIFLTTKYGGLADALQLVEPFVKEDTVFMCGTNGIISEEDIRKAYPDNITLRTIAQKMDAVYKDGQLHYSTPGEFVFGMDQPGQQEALQAVEKLFETSGMPYIVSQDIVYDQWKKLMANCGLNQTCGAYNVTYGPVVHDPKYLAIYQGAMEEVRAVANARGIALSEADVQEWIDSTKTYDPQSMPSMLQDVRAGRPTEKALFSETIVPMAKELGIKVPILEDLMGRIQEIDRQNAKKHSA